MTIIFITAIVISVVLERQERRHRLELRLEAIRTGRTFPTSGRLRPRSEAWFTLGAGALLASLGAYLLRLILTIHSPEFAAGTIEIVALTLATGLALLIIGGKGLRQNR